MEQLRQAAKELSKVTLNIQKAIHRPYAPETIEEKREEIRKLVKEINDANQKINEKYLTSEEIQERKSLVEVAGKNRTIALGILDSHRISRETEGQDNSGQNSEGNKESGSGSEPGEIDKSKTLVIKTLKMSEFDIKTAAALLPNIDSTDDSVIRLIQGIELYESMLSDAGKLLLFNYVLKIKIPPTAARLKLKDSYLKKEDLISDIKKYFLIPKSAGALSVQLNAARQGGRTIQEFGESIEDIMAKLTIAQANGDDATEKVLSNVNEKLAINAFANGLNQNDLRTIIKSRDYGTLKEAILAATEESPAIRENKVFFARKGNFRNNRGRGNFSNFQNRRGNNRNNFNSRGQGHSRGNRGNNSNRGNKNQNYRRNNSNNNNNNGQSSYVAEMPSNSQNENQNQNSVFRVVASGQQQ